MWPRKRLDIDWHDLAHALFDCAWPVNCDEFGSAAETAFCDDGRSFACLSVRSGFDLYLTTVDLPHGSEVLISAITIPDMVRIIREHGLVPVPIDIDPDTGVPPPGEIVEAATSRTRAVLIAKLFGATPLLDEQIAAARALGLLVIEDCAQAFRGREFVGHPDVDLSMFSFGTIKRATALGGAILRLRDTEILNRMRHRQDLYPVQSRYAYAQRVLKYTLFKLLETRPAFTFLVGVMRLLGRDHDRWVNSLVRGFPADQLFRLIRRRPSAPLLRLLTRRLNSSDEHREQLRSARGYRLAEALRESIECPTASENPHGFWVFPLVVDDPELIRRLLLKHGFDSTQGQSMIVVSPPPDRLGNVAMQAQTLLSRLLLLPFYSSLPDAELDRMVRVILGQVQAPLERGVQSQAR